MGEDNNSYNDTSSSSSIDHRRRVIQGKIKSAFMMNVHWSNNNNLKGLLQFWSPLEMGGRQVLSTLDQPFASSHHLDPILEKYRLFSLSYMHNIDDDDGNEDDPMVVIGGSVATAFLNNLPAVVIFDTNMVENPLVQSALECELTSSLVLPVFNYQETKTSCVGVIECSTKTKTGPDLVLMYNELKKALERVGLTTFHVQECRPYKTIPTLKSAIDEIDEALEIGSKAHNLTLAQVWIPYEIENPHVSSSLGDTQTKPTFAVKLVGYHAFVDDGDLFSTVKQYHDACDLFPLKMGDGLPGKMLQTYETHFCRNISDLSDNGLLQLLFPSKNNYCCLTICLKSKHTGNLDYGFEFMWHQGRNCRILIQSLLLTLKKCLPSFTFPFGAKHGEELCVQDVDNFTKSIIGCSYDSQGNKLSPLLRGLKVRKRSTADECILSPEVQTKKTPIPLPREDVKQQFGRTVKESASNRYEWQGRNFPKRRLSDLCRKQTDSTEEDSSASSSYSDSDSEKSPDKNTVTFKAEYGDDLIAFHLPMASITLADVEKQIDESFVVNGPYTLEYLNANNIWVIMDVDADVRFCIKYRNVNSTHIRLRVNVEYV